MQIGLTTGLMEKNNGKKLIFKTVPFFSENCDHNIDPWDSMLRLSYVQHKIFETFLRSHDLYLKQYFEKLKSQPYGYILPTKLSRGRYDHNFLRFFPIFGKKWRFS
jgi:hypothetical protein